MATTRPKLATFGHNWLQLVTHGLSPVCVLAWSLSRSFTAKPLSQMLHLYGISPVWARWKKATQFSKGGRGRRNLKVLNSGTPVDGGGIFRIRYRATSQVSDRHSLTLILGAPAPLTANALKILPILLLPRQNPADNDQMQPVT